MLPGLQQGRRTTYDDDDDEIELGNHQSQSQSHSRIQRFVKRRQGYTPADPDDEPVILTENERRVISLTERSIRASSSCRQLFTLSTLIIVVQIGVLIWIYRKDGFVSFEENPMFGPSAYTLVKYGAKQYGYILLKEQWWRLVSPIFLHAGVIHIFSNVYIQWRVGSYLYLLWGSVPWLLIYFLSGVYGNILSCISHPDDVGVGSSGSLMGILAAWVVFIIYTWNQIPEELKSDRNSQLCSVLFAITVTLLLSIVEFIDGSAHLGGALQGALLAMCFLSDEIQSTCCKWCIRLLSLGLSVASFLVTIDYMLRHIEPSRDIMEQLESGPPEDDQYQQY